MPLKDTKKQKLSAKAIGDAVDVLSQHLTLNTDGVPVFAGGEADAPLFKAVKAGNNRGGALRSEQFAELFRKYARDAALPVGISPHSARATFITLAYEAGLQGEDIQRTVGHASITTTEGYNQTAKKHRKSASFGVSY